MSQNPYVGPRAFLTGETLYGRERELRQLEALLIAERLVLLYSPSGAGKTSLIQAGLIPHLREQDFNVLPVIRVNLEPPLEFKNLEGFNRYTFSVLAALEEGRPSEARLAAADLATLSLDAYLDEHLRPAGDVVLLFDQFEEILTISPADREAKTAFFAGLGAALRKHERWALFAMREDFLGALDAYLRPLPGQLENRTRLDLLSSEAAKQAIQRPAQASGMDFTDTAANKLVDDLRMIRMQQPDGSTEIVPGQHVEPVQLQVVCHRLWEATTGQNAITENDLESIGTVNDALAKYYTTIVTKVTIEVGVAETDIREWFHFKLINKEGLRGQVLRGRSASEGLDNRAIALLEDAHILRAEKRAGSTWYELAHDRLVEPIKTSNDQWFEKHLSALLVRANLWMRQDRSESLLFRGKELKKAEDYAKGVSLTQIEHEFIHASRELKNREIREKRRNQIISFLAVGALIAMTIAIYFGVTANSATLKLYQSARDNAQLANQKAAIALTAQAASTQAIEQQSNAQLASTQAIAQQVIAQAASTHAVEQKATAQANANAAATSQAVAEQEKANAEQEKANAEKQAQRAHAGESVAQSILSKDTYGWDIATLLAIEAFQNNDVPLTRSWLLTIASRDSGLRRYYIPQDGRVTYVAFSSDSKLLGSSLFKDCNRLIIYQCSQGKFKLWNVGTGNHASDPVDFGGKIIDTFTLSPDAKVVAFAICEKLGDHNNCESENITFQDTLTGNPVGSKIPLPGEAHSLVTHIDLMFSPNGKVLAVSILDKEIVLLNTETYQATEPIQSTNGLQMTFSQDSKTLAYTENNNIVLFDIINHKRIATLKTGGSEQISNLASSPDNSLIAIGTVDGTISLWSIATQQMVGQPLVGHFAKVLSMSFSPDGKMLASGSADNTVILWDVETRQPLIPALLGHSNIVYSVAFSPDGKTLASAGDEIILWDTNPDSWIVKACQRAGRNFTRGEWNRYFSNEPYRATCPQWPLEPEPTPTP